MNRNFADTGFSFDVFTVIFVDADKLNTIFFLNIIKLELTNFIKSGTCI